jgi:hypothetical protein
MEPKKQIEMKKYKGLFNEIIKTDKMAFDNKIRQMKNLIQLMTKANKTPQEGIESEARHFDWIVAMTFDYCPSLISEN